MHRGGPATIGERIQRGIEAVKQRQETLQRERRMDGNVICSHAAGNEIRNDLVLERLVLTAPCDDDKARGWSALENPGPYVLNLFGYLRPVVDRPEGESTAVRCRQ